MDMFSKLTDDLLIKILSFTPTKDAVATSTLSKRWLSLWTLVPKLNFQDIWLDLPETNRVHCDSVSSHFVSGMLLFNKSPTLESFHLKTMSEFSPSEIGLWVRIAVDRHVRNLKLSFENEHRLVKFPYKLFRCETLETLELRRVIFLDVPCQFSFPSLKTLRLLAVKYEDEESFVRIISSSSVLENLSVQSCSDDNVSTFVINVASLRKVTVSNPLQDSGPNDNNLFVIHSESLTHLSMIDEFGEVNVIGKATELVEGSLHTLGCRGNAVESLTFAKRLSLTFNGWVDMCGF